MPDVGSFEPCLADYTTVLQLEAKNLDALYHRGTVYEKLGYIDEAIADFTVVLTLDPNHIKASYARAACRNLKGEFSQAIGEPRHKRQSCVIGSSGGRNTWLALSCLWAMELLFGLL